MAAPEGPDPLGLGRGGISGLVRGRGGGAPLCGAAPPLRGLVPCPADVEVKGQLSPLLTASALRVWCLPSFLGSGEEKPVGVFEEANGPISGQTQRPSA